jgi:membrane associated rhomboid family serine protease
MFLPLKDHNPTERTPYVTVGLIIINLAVFAYEVSLGRELSAFISAWGATPFELTNFSGSATQYQSGVMQNIGGPPIVHLTLLSSMFMHGGVMHLGGNMLYLWIFGNNVEDILGPVRFIVFYLISGLVATGAQIMVDPSSTVPTIGASGAVAGVLGAYLLAYPRARVTSLIFLGFFIRVMRVPAVIVLGVWFVMQFFSGVASLGANGGGGIAWFAHIGGFLGGMALITALASQQLAHLREARRVHDPNDRW